MIETDALKYFPTNEKHFPINSPPPSFKGNLNWAPNKKETNNIFEVYASLSQIKIQRIPKLL